MSGCCDVGTSDTAQRLLGSNLPQAGLNGAALRRFGPKKNVHTKEDADHSLPYLMAVALLDGDKLTAGHVTEKSREKIKSAVRSLEDIQVSDLMEVLSDL